MVYTAPPPPLLAASNGRLRAIGSAAQQPLGPADS